jgi:hypothetical protein
VATPITITMKQHDTRPKVAFPLWEVNQTTGAQQVVDLTNASSARLIVAPPGASVATFTSDLAFGTTRTLGTVIYTPVAGDTAVAATFNAEVEVIWSDGGKETYPNDGFFKLIVVADIPNALN